MNTWNVQDELKELNLEEIKAVQSRNTLPFSVCALNLNGDLNLGMILRTACLTGAERAFIFGRKSYDKRSTVGAQNYLDIVKISGFDDSGSFCRKAFNSLMDQYNYTPVFVEQGGSPLHSHNPLALSKKPCYIFGNEGFGIPIDFMQSSIRVSLTQRGVLRSYNVSSAASIVLYYAMSIMEST